MKKYIAFIALVLALSACKKERCLKCTTTVSGVSTEQDEICDTDKDVLDAEQEKFELLIGDFVEMGWEATVNCVRQ